MINLVENFLIEKKIKNNRVIVAISGGPDSVALLYVLNELKLKFGINLEAAYVNHGIRSAKENELDFFLIKDHCSKLNIKLHIKNVPLGEIIKLSKLQKSSIEAVARDIRYNFFNTLIDDDSLIAIGHNRDDQVETQIMRIFQGSSINSLKGILDSRRNIIRPLISIDKVKILSYLKVNNIEFNIDKTNNELDYLRNKIRHQLVPIIEDIFPSYKNALFEIEQNVIENDLLLNELLKPLIWVENDECFSVEYSTFMKLSVFQKKDELFNKFDKLFSGELNSYRLPKRFLKPLEKATFNKNEIILEGHGVKFERVNEKLYFRKISNLEYLYRMNIEGYGNFKNSRLSFAISNEKGIFISGLEFPFCLRSYNNGYPEVKIIKKLNIPITSALKIIIVEKENHVYAIICDGNVVYCKSSSNSGIYINKD